MRPLTTSGTSDRICTNPAAAPSTPNRLRTTSSQCSVASSASSTSSITVAVSERNVRERLARASEWFVNVSDERHGAPPTPATCATPATADRNLPPSYTTPPKCTSIPLGRHRWRHRQLQGHLGGLTGTNTTEVPTNALASEERPLDGQQTSGDRTHHHGNVDTDQIGAPSVAHTWASAWVPNVLLSSCHSPSSSRKMSAGSTLVS